jgi:hypothetical protein
MKKSSIGISAGILFLLAGIVACNKKYTDTAAPAQSPNQLFAAFRYTPQTITVTAGRDTVVYGDKGTMLHFYTNTFQDQTGKTLTSGTVTVQLVEMYKPADFVANRATTMSGKDLLQSGGQISIVTTQNNNPRYCCKIWCGISSAQACAANDGPVCGKHQ